jgi:hypothetical protein
VYLCVRSPARLTGDSVVDWVGGKGLDFFFFFFFWVKGLPEDLVVSVKMHCVDYSIPSIMKRKVQISALAGVCCLGSSCRI